MDDRFAHRFELAATLLLAVAAVESTRAANVANRQGQVDVALFTQWVDAYAREEDELAAFYRKRFRPEFVPAFDLDRDVPGERLV